MPSEPKKPNATKPEKPKPNMLPWLAAGGCAIVAMLGCVVCGGVGAVIYFKPEDPARKGIAAKEPDGNGGGDQSKKASGAKALAMEFEENRFAFGDKYKGKTLDVKRTVAGFGMAWQDPRFRSVTLENANKIQFAFMEDRHGQVAALTKGQSVTIRGRYHSADERFVYFSSCEVLK